MAKAPDPAKPNQPKSEIGKVQSGAPPPVTPFGGRMQTGGQGRGMMAQQLLQQGQNNSAQTQNEAYLRQLAGQ